MFAIYTARGLFVESQKVKKKMKTTIGVVAALVATFSISALADQLPGLSNEANYPNKADYMAAYCEAVTQSYLADSAALQQTDNSNLSEDMKRNLAKGPEIVTTNLHRMQNYLASRWLPNNNDPLALVGASAQGKEDWAHAQNDSNVCSKTCIPQLTQGQLSADKLMQCVTKCRDESISINRTKRCSDLSFLPY